MSDLAHEPWRITAAAVVIAVAAQSLFDAYTGLTLEDALITFRFAENLATGGGYAFFPGDVVQGTTTPLFTLLLAAIGVALGPAAIWPAADVVNLAAVAGTAALSASILRKEGLDPWWSALGAAVVTVGPKFLVAGAGGMETPVVLLLMAASLRATQDRRVLLAAALCALLVLVRLDGLVWAALVVLVHLRRDPKQALLGIALGAALLAPWVAWATWAFGSPVPQSVLAKDVIRPLRYAYALGEPSSLVAWARWSVPRWAEVTGGLPPGLLLTGYGAVKVVRERSTLGVLVAHAALFPVAFYVGHGPWFGWYLLPAAWGGGLVAVVGLAAIADRFPRSGRPMAALVVASLVATSAWQAHSYRIAQQNEDGLRRAVGEWIDANTPPEAVVAMEAIGYQGYFAHRRVVDLAGLVSPEVVELATDPYDPGATFARILAELHPDVVVLRSFEVTDNEHFHGGPLFATEDDRARFLAEHAVGTEIQAPHPEAAGRLGALTVWIRRAP